MLRTPAYILGLLLSSLAANAQLAGADPVRQQLKNGRPDTTHVQKLLTEGRRCLLKPGEEIADLDSAIQFASQAVAISRHIAYPQGIQAGTLLIANIHMEAKRYSTAWALYDSLADTCRIQFLSTMIRYQSDAGTIPDPLPEDSFRRWRNLVLPLVSSLRGPDLIPDLYYPLAELYGRMHDTRQLVDWIRQGWQRLRVYNDIKIENKYVYYMGRVSCQDSLIISPALTILDQLAADEDRLLPGLTLKEQNDAITDITEAALNYNYYTPFQQPGIRLEKLAMRLNQQFHLHNSYPWYILADTYSSLGKTKEALSLALEGVRVSETPDGAVDGTGYQAATKLYYLVGDYDKALLYLNKALALYTKDPTLIRYPGKLIDYGVVTYLDLHRPAEAMQLLHWAKRQAKIDLKFVGEAGNVFYELGRYDSAEYYYRSALGNYTLRKNAAYTYLARLQMRKGQYARARPLIDTVTADIRRPGISLRIQLIAWLLRYQLDSIARNYPRAMDDMRYYNLLRDSFINVAKNRQLAEIDVQYETEKKNQHIADLEQQTVLQATLQQATIRHDRIVRNGLIGGAILLALLLILLFSRYRLRQRSNQLLNQVNAHQQQLLVQKEWLMREVHHRVKNSLQLVISLLDMQVDSLKDQLALRAFDDTLARIRAISLIHQKLYREDQDVTVIPMREYIEELLGFLQDSFSSGRHILFHLDIEPIELGVDQGVPVGLILNEAITNAMKYAFPDSPRVTSRPGRSAAAKDSALSTLQPPDHTEAPAITISLRKQSASNIKLTIADNGTGLPPGVDLDNTGSMGLHLIQTLGAQLDGTLSLENTPGLCITICFPIEMIDPIADPLLSQSDAILTSHLLTHT